MKKMYKTEYHVTPDELRTLVDYDPDTGIFTWKTRYPETTGNNIFNANFAGKEAGGKSEGKGQGYMRIKAFGKMLKAHRAAFAWMDGEWPDGYVDHIDGNIANNAWNNLRIVEKRENGLNQKQYSNNKTGVTGVFWDKNRRKWKAQIGGTGTKFYQILGYFSDIEEAIEARKAAEISLGYHKNHGKRR